MNRTLKPYQLLVYGIPGLPLAILGLPLFVYLPTYYSQSLGLSLSAVGLALLMARALDVITDPLIGILNDQFSLSLFKNDYQKTSKKWRRKSFILLGIPLLLIGLNFLLRPSSEVTALYLFFWSFITYLGWTLINIPWLAWGAEISPNYHEKSLLASSREIFAVFGTIIAVSILVLLSIESDLQQVLEHLARLLNWLIPLSLALLLWRLPDEPYFSFNDKHTSEKTNNKPHKFNIKQLHETVSHPAVKKLFPVYFINSFANALPATLFILYVTHFLKLPDQVGLLLMSYFLAAVVGLPLWLYLAKKTDKHISWMIALLVSIASFIAVPFLSAGDFYPFLTIAIISGFALGADVVLPSSIQADIAQHIQQNRTPNYQQKNSTGLLFGLWGLLTKLALALAIGIAFPLLDSVGFNTNAPSETGITTLVILYVLVPITLKLWVVSHIWNYPFNQDYFTQDSLSQPLKYIAKGKQNEDSHNSNHTKIYISAFSVNSTNKRMQ